MLQYFQTIVFISLAVVCAVATLHPRIADTLLQRIGMVLVFFACVGAANRVLQDLPVTDRQLYALVYGTVIFALASLTRRGRPLDRRSRPRKSHHV